MTDTDSVLGEPRIKRKFIIAVDYGTTYSSVSYIIVEDGQSIAEKIEDIRTIEGYDGEPENGPWTSVPTELWYPDDDYARAEETYANPANGLNHNGEDPESDLYMEDGDLPLWRPQDQVEHRVPEKVIWGYKVQDALGALDTQTGRDSRNKPILRAKLLLDHESHTQEQRDKLTPTLQYLRRKKLIKRNEDVITDFLACLLRHTKEKLEELHSFSVDECDVEVVMCVPVIWNNKACRTMQWAMGSALQAAGFRTENDFVSDLFIVSEPEAAATFVLAEQIHLMKNEVFMLIDAGGGTIDVITYKVNLESPLRLEKQVAEPEGAMNGSSFINERFRTFMTHRLQTQREGVEAAEGKSIEGVVDGEDIMPKFEMNFKRRANFEKQSLCNRKYKVMGLVENKALGVLRNNVSVEYKDLEAFFRPSLLNVVGLMRSQLYKAETNNIPVDKVILTGGFAASPALQAFLLQELKPYRNVNGNPIRLILPEQHSNGAAISAGAALRALDKEHGPARNISSSYGILYIEEYDPRRFRQHRECSYPKPDQYDGIRRISTIDWIIKKDSEVAPDHTDTRELLHMFAPTRERFLCEELLYLSDTSKESHYTKYHPYNKKQYELIGKIVIDMTFLRNENIIGLTKLSTGSDHYAVKFDLHIQVMDRNLKVWGTWPPRSEGGQGERLLEGSVRYINMAAAFAPGTK
ncbi:hypothetical protein EJ08DRAFT_595282 [Tothia fuscella]|uniref:Uncharacterized protein n=1 Tax=Tothia fuscella TaxID=1048955 RepID=A0A9P4NJN8_9PEZI|nr:hypothetical protein EJ08DRAFT_595282 [Tothia fuscella]